MHEVEDCIWSVQDNHGEFREVKKLKKLPMAFFRDPQLTLLNAVLIGLAVLLLLLLDALGALVVVVLERGALLGLHALYRNNQ